MDSLGNIIRSVLKEKEEETIRTARTLVFSLKKEGMDKQQIEEMLYFSNYEEDIIKKVLDITFNR